MAKIQNLVSATLNRATEVAGKAGQAGQAARQTVNEVATRATDPKSLAETALQVRDEVVDRWEQAPTKETLSQLRETGQRAQAGMEEIQKAVVGQAATEVSNGLVRVAQWMEPSRQAVQALQEARQSVETGVREALSAFDPEAIREAYDFAASEVGDLAQRIEAHLENLENLPSRLDLKLRAEVGNATNVVLNAAAGTVAQMLGNHTDKAMVVSMGFSAMSDMVADVPGADLLKTAFPPAHAALTGARWCLNVMAEITGSTAQLAQHFSETPGLPTKGNFDEWIEAIEPGTGLYLKGSFVGEVIKGAGATLGGEGSLVVERDAANPDLVTLTLGRGLETGAGVGASAQGEGISGVVGKRFAQGLELQFDLSQPEDRLLLRDLVLAQQTGISSKSVIDSVGEHLTSYSLSMNGFAKVSAGGDFLSKLEGTYTSGFRLETEQRKQGVVHRASAQLSGALSFGSAKGRIPQEMLTELGRAAPEREQQFVAQALAALSGGELGGKVGAGLGIGVVAEFENQSLERIVVEAEINGQFMGFEGKANLELVLHDPVGLAQMLGMSTAQIMEDLSNGRLDLAAVHTLATAQSMDIQEIFGLKITASSTSVDGFGIDVANLSASYTTQRTQQVTIADWGNTLDRSPPARERLTVMDVTPVSMSFLPI